MVSEKNATLMTEVAKSSVPGPDMDSPFISLILTTALLHLYNLQSFK